MKYSRKAKSNIRSKRRKLSKRNKSSVRRKTRTRVLRRKFSKNVAKTSKRLVGGKPDTSPSPGTLVDNIYAFEEYNLDGMVTPRNVTITADGGVVLKPVIFNNSDFNCGCISNECSPDCVNFSHAMLI